MKKQLKKVRKKRNAEKKLKRKSSSNHDGNLVKAKLKTKIN